MDFYYAPASPQCRAVMLAAKSLGVDLNKKFIDYLSNQQKSAEFTKINPRQSVPTIVDGDLRLFEGGAILIYLVEKYGKNDSLYPKELSVRSKINTCLFFVAGTLIPRFTEYQLPITRDGKAPDSEKKEKIKEAVGWVNTFQEGHQYAVGNTITIADFAMSAILSTFKEMGADFSSFSNVLAYLDRCEKNIPGYDSENLEGAKKLAAFIKSKMS